jgi:hypothetical protein
LGFLVSLNNEVLGTTDLEGGDPPMGVASGRLYTTDAYRSIQRYCVDHRDSWVELPGLSVMTESGVKIECSGGIQIIDFSPEIGEEGIQIHLNGVLSPP